jgi:hypothetical protein
MSVPFPQPRKPSQRWTWHKVKAGVYQHVDSGVCVVHTRGHWRSPWELGRFEGSEMVISGMPSDGFRTLREARAHVEREVSS